MAILSHTVQLLQERSEYWREVLAELRFDPATQYISAEQASAAAVTSLRARLNILLRAYNQDYHTDSFDFDRLSTPVRDGWERIIFWGEAESIGALREWMSSHHEPTESELDLLKLGTATILDVREEFGEGYAEMCRTGSVCQTVAASGPILHDLLHLLQGGLDGNFARHHTFLSVPRNRTTTPGIRGGAAIQRLHVREIRSSFWGIAPWYVMQGGYLEALDYREVYRRPDDVIRGLECAPDIYCSSEGDAKYVTALMKLNFGTEIELPHIHVQAEGQPASVRWSMSTCQSPSLEAFNPTFIRPSSTGAFANLRDAVTFSETRSHACTVVHLVIDDRSTIPDQCWLNQMGFRLAAVSPPKHSPTTALSDGMASERASCYGIWSRPGTDFPLAEPYYLARSGQSLIEDEIISYLSVVCKEWQCQ